jgi:hypothetical protein
MATRYGFPEGGAKMTIETSAEKKEYSPPKIVGTEIIEARSVECVRADDVCAQQGGPVQS